MARMKHQPDNENEIGNLVSHADAGQLRVTPVLRLSPAAAREVVSAVAAIVREGHAEEVRSPTPPGELRRAQEFEEGDVFMLEAPFEGFFADRYLMDFYDVRSRDMCSRMHLHTGLRFVRIMTGPDTSVRISSLTPLLVHKTPAWPLSDVDAFVDELPADEAETAEDSGRPRFNVVVPANTWIDVQVPRGVSHQFNADGPNAVIDSVHPEESIETLREGMSGYKMMAQTIFLTETKPSSETCLTPLD